MPLEPNMGKEAYPSQVLNPGIAYFSDKGFVDSLNIVEAKDSNVALLQMLEGIPMDREEFLHKSWGFQELLASSAMGLQPHRAEYDVFINPGEVQIQPFDPDSCITHVSDQPCTSSLIGHHQEGKEKEQHSGLEEGFSSASCHDQPAYSSENCNQKNATSSSCAPAVNDTKNTSNTNNVRERKKRKRSKQCKNIEEAESQRMTHIAVERNRRKQMNEHLSVLKSLMPGSFIQRGDQASVIGGAIDFIKELEHLLQSLQAQKSKRQFEDQGSQTSSTSSAFSSFINGFFQSPQYTSYSDSKGFMDNSKNKKCLDQPDNEFTAESKSAIADIEVTMIETHAALKILSQRRPGQLVKLLTALVNLDMSILHLNVNTISHSVLYSFSVKLEEGCRQTSADEIARAVHNIFSLIHSGQ